MQKGVNGNCGRCYSESQQSPKHFEEYYRSDSSYPDRSRYFRFNRSYCTVGCPLFPMLVCVWPIKVSV